MITELAGAEATPAGEATAGSLTGTWGARDEAKVIAEDVMTLHSLGYAQELWRRMSGFSNFAVSFSIICVPFVTISFHAGFCTVGGAAMGLGWPLASLL